MRFHNNGVRTLADRDCYTSNTEIRMKMQNNTNAVTCSVYRTILKNRAIRAIEKQPFFSLNTRKGDKDE